MKSRSNKKEIEFSKIIVMKREMKLETSLNVVERGEIDELLEKEMSEH